MQRKPIIGITPTASTETFDHGTFRRYCISTTYVDAVRAAGGIPIVLPTSETDLRGVLDAVDGLILSGGSDLDPALYGDSSVHASTYGIDPERDSFEIALFRLAVEQDKPVFGICRGIQSMNVALGGTLIQDIPSALSGDPGHRQHELGKSQTDVSHAVSVVGESLLATILGSDSISVNSYHHQGIGTPASALEIVATSEDGVVESLWHPGMHFVLGVQWHPEMLAAQHEEQAALFRALVEAASRVAVIPN